MLHLPFIGFLRFLLIFLDLVPVHCPGPFKNVLITQFNFQKRKTFDAILKNLSSIFLEH